MTLPASSLALSYKLRHLADYMSTTESTQDFQNTQRTFVFPSSWDEKSMWNGRFEDFMISSCRRVDPFASTTLYNLKKRSSCMFCRDTPLHKVFLLQPLKSRSHIWPPFTVSILQQSFVDAHLMRDETVPLWSCQAATSLFLTPSSHCAGVTPRASNSQFSTRRCVTSMSSTG